jgi:hypothetical protein
MNGIFSVVEVHRCVLARMGYVWKLFLAEATRALGIAAHAGEPERRSAHPQRGTRAQLATPIGSLLLLCSALAPAVASANTELPRIGTRAAYPAPEFYDKHSGARFEPRGLNYVALTWEPYLEPACVPGAYHHSAFNVGLYNPLEAHHALNHMQQDHFNVVRVFVKADDWCMQVISPPHYGPAGPNNHADETLDVQFMENAHHFLTLARDHGVYVIITFEGIPNNAYYQSIWFPCPRDLQETNCFYLHLGQISAFAGFVGEFVKELKNRDPSVLSTVLAYELQNEIYFTDKYRPFSLDRGLVQMADGNTYRMGSATQRQAAMDNNVVLWANRAAEAIHNIDPEALVSGSVFTAYSVGKETANAGALPIPPPGWPDWQDYRFPARPLVLLRDSSLSYVDIHVYPWTPRSSFSVDQAVETSEYASFDLVNSAKPLLMGEFGANEEVYPYPDFEETAAHDLRAHVADATDLGFAGSLFWQWQSHEVLGHWGIVDSPLIEAELSPSTLFYRPLAGFQLVDWNEDGAPDLVYFKKTGTGSASTEVHIASGASDGSTAPFATSLMDVGTAFGETGSEWEFQMADWNGDGVLDLVGIQKRSTLTHSTEVHVLSGEWVPNLGPFRTHLLYTGTSLWETGDEWSFQLLDWDGNGVLDLVGVRRKWTGSTSTEVHILSGVGNFHTWLLQTGTAFPEAGDDWSFQLVDWNADGTLDLVGFHKAATGSSRTEVHVLSGTLAPPPHEGRFQTSLSDVPTAFPPTSDTTFFSVGRWTTNGPWDLVGVKRINTHSGTNAEVRIAQGACQGGALSCFQTDPEGSPVFGTPFQTDGVQ